MTDERVSSAVPRTSVNWRDLSDELAVIIKAPGVLYPGDGFRDEAGRWVQPVDNTAERFEPFAAEFRRAVRELYPDRELPTLTERVDRYYPGRYASGGAYEAVAVLISLLPIANAAAQSVTAWAQLGEYAFALKRWWFEVCRTEGVPVTANDAPIFTRAFVEAACLHHTLSTYARPGDPVEVKTTLRPVGYGTAAHPTGVEQYSVQVEVGRTSYVYSVDGRLRPWEHLRIRNGKIMFLPLPDFGDYAGVSDPRVGRGDPSPLAARTLTPERRSGRSLIGRIGRRD